jgi:hypothetical protein
MNIKNQEMVTKQVFCLSVPNLNLKFGLNLTINYKF